MGTVLVDKELFESLWSRLKQLREEVRKRDAYIELLEKQISEGLLKVK